MASAKVNIGLHVGGLRPDGYHEVRGLVQTITLHDLLKIRVHDDPGDVGGGIVDDLAGVPVGLDVDGPEASADLASPDNLVLVAARTLAGRLAPQPTTITLTKRIPAAAGLGGGSADAAAALTGLALAWSADLSGERLTALAAQVGSDVPAILSGGLVHVSGRGERVRHVGCATGTGFVLGVGGKGLSTPEVYARLDELRAAGADHRAEQPWWHNDLEPAALSLDPSLEEGLHSMRRAGVAAAFVTGSGPTVVGVVSGLDEARAAAGRVHGEFRAVLACEASEWGVRLTLPRPAG